MTHRRRRLSLSPAEADLTALLNPDRLFSRAMPEASGAREPPPPELVRGETPYWKMADVQGLVVRHLVTGYLVTNYRCFIWDVKSNVVRASVPIGLADATVEGRRPGKRSKRGGNFIVPQTVNYAQPAMGEPVEMGDLLFLVKGEPVMAFRDVADPLNVKALIDALKTHSKAHMSPPREVGVDILWSDPDGAAGNRT